MFQIDGTWQTMSLIEQGNKYVITQTRVLEYTLLSTLATK